MADARGAPSATPAANSTAHEHVVPLLPGALGRLSWPAGFPPAPGTPVTFTGFEEVSTAGIRMYVVQGRPVERAAEASPRPRAAAGVAAALAASTARTSVAPTRPAAPTPAPLTVERLQGYLGHVVARQGWTHSFWPAPKLRELCEGLVFAEAVSALDLQHSFPERPLGLFAASLFDHVVLCDDSASMRADVTYGSVDCGGRWRQALLRIESLVDVTTRLGSGGPHVVFLNTGDPVKQPVTDGASLRELMQGHECTGETHLASALTSRVYPELRREAAAKSFTRPKLVHVVTDGEPNSRRAVFKALARFASQLERAGLPRNAVLYNFSQVGDDRVAQQFLAALDVDPRVGHLVDTTASFKLESEAWRAHGRTLTEAGYRIKLVVGAADPLWDRRNEPRPKGKRLRDLLR